jgi:hypothetical protein
VLLKFTDVSEVLAASIVMAMMTEAARISETSVNFTVLHGTTAQVLERSWTLHFMHGFSRLN